MRRLAIAVVLASLASTAAALEPAERALLERSLRASELKVVESATGGLDSLALLTVDVALDLDGGTVRGQARLDWRNRTGQVLSEIPLRLSANGDGDGPPRVTFDGLSVQVNGGPVTTEVARAGSACVTWVPLPVPLLPGQRVVVSGRLEGTLAHIDAGATDPVQASLGALMGGGAAPSGDGYGTFACGDGICTLTGFTPEVPAWISSRFDTDESSGIGDATFSEPANLLLSVVAPASALVAATGLEIGRVPAGTGLRRTSFALAAARDVGVVASRDYVIDKAVVDGVTVRSLSRSSDRASGRRALDAAKTALVAFDKVLGKYPWSTLDIAESALVGGAGGVELPALALGASGFYRRPEGMLAMADPSGRFMSDTLAFITRHEVAHQWWHAQVGSHSQKHPYVDEPLAQWCALLATRRALGPAAAKRARDSQVAVNFQALGMMGLHDGVVARPAGDFQSMLEYAGIVYGKAPLFYEAAEKLIGEEALAAGLRAVVTRWRFARVSPDELRHTLMNAAGAKAAAMDALWTRWFDEVHGDEDVGAMDLASLMGAMGGLGAGLGALGGASGTMNLPPGLLGGGSGQDVTPAEAMKLLKQMMKELGEE